MRSLALYQSEIVIQHEAIPGLMPRMTMPFHLRDTNIAAGLVPGSKIEFDLIVEEEGSWISAIRRTSDDASNSTREAVASSRRIIAGAALPEVELLSESGATLNLRDFEGKVVALTFIFTRCPLPEFCPRMNQNFRRARNILLEDRSVRDWQFLSISFDGVHDTPEKLAAYAPTYRGSNPSGWLFAAADSKSMEALSNALDFRYVDRDGTFIHNLRTVVLDRRGRIAAEFEGNKWTAEALVQAMKRAAGTP